MFGFVNVSSGEAVQAIIYRQFGGPEVLEVIDATEPRIERGSDVLIDVHAASVVPGDCKLRSGTLSHLFPVTLPKTPGRDGAGIVRAVGAGVRSVAPGDRVCFYCSHLESGSYADCVVRPETDVVPIPSALSFAEAASLTHAGICAGLAINETLEVGAGDTVLIQGGAGAIGGLAIQLSKHLGARVLATCRFANADHARSLGAEFVFAYDKDDVLQGVTAAVGKVDAVLDLVGGTVNEQSCQLVRPGGRIAHLIAAPFEDRSAEYGVSLRQVAVRDCPETLRMVLSLAAKGIVRPLVAGLLPLSEAREAHRRVETGEVSRGRLILASSR